MTMNEGDTYIDTDGCRWEVLRCYRKSFKAEAKAKELKAAWFYDSSKNARRPWLVLKMISAPEAPDYFYQ